MSRSICVILTKFVEPADATKRMPRFIIPTVPDPPDKGAVVTVEITEDTITTLGDNARWKAFQGNALYVALGLAAIRKVLDVEQKWPFAVGVYTTLLVSSANAHELPAVSPEQVRQLMHNSMIQLEPTPRLFD